MVVVEHNPALRWCISYTKFAVVPDDVQTMGYTSVRRARPRDERHPGGFGELTALVVRYKSRDF